MLKTKTKHTTFVMICPRNKLWVIDFIYIYTCLKYTYINFEIGLYKFVDRLILNIISKSYL